MYTIVGAHLVSTIAWRAASALHDARPWRAQAQGGEDMLLDEFEGLGLHCEPRTQLVVLCEVCRRPSTKECWTCRMKICDFCTLKRHWKARSSSSHNDSRQGRACGAQQRILWSLYDAMKACREAHMLAAADM
ncbi:hypothetical protein CVIRNUC_002402 [Coccomyxa viridis]|uniref:B box-type domain-containing protein n=1 Tax=Coccomyxa viridis TaxID=1274662 RepID=A0AAV1HYC0_9CHLO|nr:hypothetical protein CVIRNUC_002402 [Coccomyxa viridis]